MLVHSWTFVETSFSSKPEYCTSKAKATLADSFVTTCLLGFSFICLPSCREYSPESWFWERGRAIRECASAAKCCLCADPDLLPSEDLHPDPCSRVPGFTNLQPCDVCLCKSMESKYWGEQLQGLDLQWKAKDPFSLKSKLCSPVWYNWRDYEWGLSPHFIPNWYFYQVTSPKSGTLRPILQVGSEEWTS